MEHLVEINMDFAHQQLYNNNRVAGGQCSSTPPLVKINIIIIMNSNQSNSNDRLDRLEALVANYVETSVKESAEFKSGFAELKSGLSEFKSGFGELKSGLDETRQLVNSVARSAQANSEAIAELKSGLDETRQLVNSVARSTQANSEAIAELKSGLDETRQLVNSVARSAQANSDAIAELRRERQATDKQVAQLTREVADFVKTTKEGVAKLIEDRATMFEMIQSLNDDRVKWAENLASIASSLNKMSQQ